MQLSGILFLSCCKIIVHSIFLALVSVEVKSQCIEKDCLGDHIRVVNGTTRECISCYACLDCHVGSPSVPCGATVPDGTVIDCDGPRPRPELSKVSTASSYAKSGSLTSLATSSVPLSHTILLQSSLLITTALITSSTPSAEIIHPSSLVEHLPSSTVQTQSGSTSVVTGKTRNKREFPVDGSYAPIYIFGGILFLVVILGLIVCTCSFKQYQHPTGNEPASNDELLSCVISSDRESEALALRPVTSAGTAMKDQVSQEENVNQDFQPGEALIDEIPPSLESNMEGEPASEGEDQNLESADGVLVDLSPVSHQPTNRNNDLPALNNSTSIVASSVNILVHSNPSFQQLSHQTVPHSLHVWNTQPGEIQSGRPTNWQAIPLIEKYATKMLDVPIPLFNEICLLLDVKRIDGRDVSLLAHKLGCSISDFALLQQAAQIRATTTTYSLLTENFNGTVGDFVDIMKNMGRDDIIRLIINEWNG